MNWKRLGGGTGLGIIAAVMLSIVVTVFIKALPDSSLVNFAPGIGAAGALALLVLIAVIAIVSGGVSLFWKRWERAVFFFAFGISIFAWFIKLWLY